MLKNVAKIFLCILSTSLIVAVFYLFLLGSISGIEYAIIYPNGTFIEVSVNTYQKFKYFLIVTIILTNFYSIFLSVRILSFNQLSCWDAFLKPFLRLVIYK